LIEEGEGGRPARKEVGPKSERPKGGGGRKKPKEEGGGEFAPCAGGKKKVL